MGDVRAMLDQVIELGVRHFDEDCVPHLYDAPPGWLATAIAQAREHGRSGNLAAARATVHGALSGDNQKQRIEFGKYREHVTWVAGENAKHLASLAYLWTTLRRQPSTPEIEATLERLERLAALHYSVTELRLDRGWAESQTRQSLLPPAWVNA